VYGNQGIPSRFVQDVRGDYRSTYSGLLVVNPYIVATRLDESTAGWLFFFGKGGEA
jgi:hypothetical protein